MPTFEMLTFIFLFVIAFANLNIEAKKDDDNPIGATISK